MSIFLAFMFMLMSTKFSLAYTCACAYAYALVKTMLNCQYSQDEIDSFDAAPVKELTLYANNSLCLVASQSTDSILAETGLRVHEQATAGD